VPVGFYIGEMRSILLFCLLTTNLTAFCQDWQNILSNDGKGALCRNLIAINDTTYVLWNRIGDSSGFAGLTLIQLDSNGIVLDTLDFFIEDGYLTSFTNSTNCLAGEQSDNIIFWGSDINNRLYLTFFNFKTREKRIVFYNQFDIGFQFQGNTAIEVSANGIFLTGQVQRTDTYGTSDAFVIHTDLEGNEIWRKTYGMPDVEDTPMTIIQKSENEIVIAGGRFSPFGNVFLPPSQIFGKELFITIDTLGNQLSEWVSTGTQNFGSIRGMHAVHGKFYYSGTYLKVLQNDYEFLSYIGCRDSNLNVLWRTPITIDASYRLNVINSTVISPDSLYITGAGRIHLGGPMLHFKVRLADGEVIYQRNDTVCVPNMLSWGTPPLLWPYDANLYDIATLSSGSTVSCGVVDVLTTEGRRISGYILKTNAWGEDLLEDCSTVSSEEPQYTQNELFIYPNPCSARFTLEPPAYTGAYRVRMYASTGALAHEQACEQGETPEIEVSQLQNGLYFVQIVSEQGSLLSVGKVLVAH
jgi:hypothetical protein